MSHLLSLFALYALSQEPPFLEGALSPAAVNPNALALGDFDADGLLDAVVGGDGIGGAAATLSLATGAGRFGPPTPILGSGQGDITAVYAADLNGDGALDALATSAFGPVRFFPGNGQGQLGAALASQDSGSIASLLRDVDGDGVQDLVLVGFLGGPNLIWRRGNGTGGFTFGASLAFAASSIAADDFDGDGALDLVAVQYPTGIVHRFLGVSGQGFGAAVSLGITAPPATSGVSYPKADLRPADVNGDGAVDLVVGGARVAVHLGDGAGAFGPAILVHGDEVQSVVAGDWNADGRAELVAADVLTMRLVTFDAQATPSLADVLPDNSVLGGLVAADLDGDGSVDLGWVSLSLGSLFPGFISTRLGRPVATGDTPRFRAGSFEESGFVGAGLVLADLDIDGSLEYVMARVGDPLVLDSNRQPIFDTGAPLNFLDGALVAVGRFTALDRRDIIVADETNSLLRFWRADGNGGYQLTQSAPTPSMSFLAPAQLDGDAPQELLVVRDGEVALLDPNGSGALNTVASVAIAGFSFEASAGDVDGDGLVDVVAINRTGTGANAAGHVVLGTSAPGLTRIGGFQVPGLPLATALADLDGDGALDLVVGHVTAGTGANAKLSVALGDGAGGFGAWVDVDLPGWPGYILPGDLDVDGDLDLLVTCISGAATLLGRGDGTFDFVSYQVLGRNGLGFALLDTNGDSRLDLVGAHADPLPASGFSWIGNLGAYEPVALCPQSNNSTGAPGELAWTGTTSLATNDLVLRATQLPPSSACFFFAGTTVTSVPLGGGVRCAGGALRRLSSALPTGAAGACAVALDLTSLPGGAPLLGATWVAQGWYRDSVSGSHLTHALRLTFAP